MLSSENLLRKYKNLPLSFPHVYKTSRDLVRIEEKLLRILSQEKDVLSPDCTGYCVTSKQNGEVVWEMQDLHVKVKKGIEKSSDLWKESTSSKKSPKKRLQVFTRSAKSAIKVIFSREHICRPNDEERRQNPHRSRKSYCLMRRLRIPTCFRRKKECTDNQTDSVCHDSYATLFLPT
ncbi:uncharacterized protein LOC143222744 isoform X2 [Tachypleus tridentatus]|uniref:uncharacterized protein LOC143222744 isoform X2 n=1 Tax=Tachypleus tridentatus TaxID=6853 RepID=UPI003FCF1D87